jgi:hypothetical protein
MTKSQYNAFVKGKPMVGRPDGQFMTTGKQMNKLLQETGGDIAKINKKLGTTFDEADELIRVDVKAPLNYNARNPNSGMSGANAEFVEGGNTSGGVSEVVTDQIPAVDLKISNVTTK